MLRPQFHHSAPSSPSSIRSSFASSGSSAADLLDEALGVLATDEDVEGVTERALGRGRIVDDGVDARHERMTATACAVEMAAQDRSKRKARRSGPSVVSTAVGPTWPSTFETQLS